MILSVHTVHTVRKQVMTQIIQRTICPRSSSGPRSHLESQVTGTRGSVTDSVNLSDLYTCKPVCVCVLSDGSDLAPCSVCALTAARCVPN